MHANARATELQQAIGEYLREDPIHIVQEQFIRDSTDFLRFRYQVRTKPPARLSILLGEVVHQLRATLDNLVWAMGQCYPSPNPRARNELLSFPVANTELHFKKLLMRPDYVGIRDFPAEGYDAIYAAQTFRRGLDTPNLGVLNALWNSDKHRLPNIILGHSGSLSQNLGLMQPSFASTGPITDGGIFAEGAIPPEGIGQGTGIYITVELSIPDPQGPGYWSLLILLYEQIRFVTNITARLSPLLRPQEQ